MAKDSAGQGPASKRPRTASAGPAASAQVKSETLGQETTPASSAPQNIFDCVQKSTYGTFMGALKELNITSGLRLPQVVVIGNESVGKSSLLENITKCSIFPADHSQCTRTPMRLKLVHVESPAAKKIIVEYQNNVQELRSRDEVLACVTTIMKSIPRSFQSTEIKVTICEDDIPSFEFVDLPGVVQFPPEAHQKSKEIIGEYLKEPTTMVICVTQATSQLNESAALALVYEHKRQANTIIALTKCDEVGAAIEHRIIDRILGTSAELVGMPKCAGMVGVINRVTGTKTSLVQAAAEEQKVFQEKVLSKLAQQNGDRRNQILSNITIPNLILKIDQHFSKFIKDTWKPLALQQLTPKIANTEADIRRLGLPINRLTVPKVMAEILQQMDPAIMCAEIIKIDVPIAIRPLDNTSPPSVRTMTDFNNSGYPGTWGTPEWALMNRRVKEAIEQVMLGIFHGDIKHALFLASLQAPIKAAFDKQPADPAAPGIKLSRFSALKTQLLSHTLTQMYESAMLRLWESSVRDVINQHMASLSSHSFAMANLKQLDSTIKGLIMEEFMEVLQSKLPGAQLPASFKLSEESNHAKRRVELNGTLQKLKKATETIQAC